MKTTKKGLVAICAFLMSTFVDAIESKGFITESGMQIVPLFDTKLEHVDNIGRFSKEEKPESSTVLIVEPGLAFASDRNGNRYQIYYQMSSGTYFDSSEDNYLDHRFATNNFIQVNRRNGVGLNYSFFASHEERGTGILAGDSLATIADGPAKFHLHNVSGTYVYGSEGAKGKVETNLRYENKRYTNYRNVTIAENTQLSTRYKDYAEFGGGIALYYQAFPLTQLLFEVDTASRDFDLDDPSTGESQDNINTYYYLGAKWDITGKTDGRLRFGLQDKSYEDANKEDFNGFSWDLDLTWKPLNHSTVTFSAAQRATDPNQGSDFVDVTSFDWAWKHFWLTHFYSNITLAKTTDDYSESVRKDELFRSSISLGYELREQADISIGWRNENNNSSIAQNTYDQNVWYLAVNIIF